MPWISSLGAGTRQTGGTGIIAVGALSEEAWEGRADEERLMQHGQAQLASTAVSPTSYEPT